MYIDYLCFLWSLQKVLTPCFMRLAVGLPLVLKEAAVDERREALLETEEGGGLFRLGGWGPRQLPGDGQGTVRAATLQTIPPRTGALGIR